MELDLDKIRQDKREQKKSEQAVIGQLPAEKE